MISLLILLISLVMITFLQEFCLILQKSETIEEERNDFLSGFVINFIELVYPEKKFPSVDESFPILQV